MAEGVRGPVGERMGKEERQHSKEWAKLLRWQQGVWPGEQMAQLQMVAQPKCLSNIDEQACCHQPRT